jgi:hypothetical protein
VRHVLREGFGIRNPEKFMMPEAAQMLQLQQQAIMQQTAMAAAPPPMPGEAPQGQGADAPQRDPRELLALQNGEVPTQAQLAGQSGVPFG